MPPDLSYLWMPLLGCLVLVGIHAWLGIHVLSRGVIFVDLALAQIAALGATLALMKGLDPGSVGSYGFSLSFTLLGAGVLAATRSRRGRIPQEAVIGIVYAVASAASVVVMSQVADTHGVEKIRAIMLGRSIVWLTGHTVLKTAAIYLVVGIFHFIYRRQFLLVSLNPQGAREQGLNLPLWDFLFYASFGVVITSSVQIAGVLLVFSFLIVPSVIGALFSRNLMTRLLIGWSCGSVAAFLGMLFSYELPSGPVVVVTFGGLLLLASLAAFIKSADHSFERALKAAAWLLLGALIFTALLVPPWARILGRHARAGEASPGLATPGAKGQGLFSKDPLERERAQTRALSDPSGTSQKDLFLAFAKETEPDLKVHLAEEGLRLHDQRYLKGLVQFLPAIKAPFFQSEALHLLERYTGLHLMSLAPEQALSRVQIWWQKEGSRLHWDDASHRFVTP